MALELNGTTGVSAVQAGSIQSDDLAAGVGGKVLQVVNAEHSTAESTTSGSFVDTSLNLSITPSSTSSKIVLFCTVPFKTERNSVNSGGAYFAIDRQGTVIVETNLYIIRTGSSGVHILRSHAGITYTDVPNTASSLTYTFQQKSNDGQTVTAFELNKTGTLTAMEIAG